MPVDFLENIELPIKNRIIAMRIGILYDFRIGNRQLEARTIPPQIVQNMGPDTLPNPKKNLARRKSPQPLEIPR